MWRLCYVIVRVLYVPLYLPHCSPNARSHQAEADVIVTVSCVGWFVRSFEFQGLYQKNSYLIRLICNYVISALKWRNAVAVPCVAQLSFWVNSLESSIPLVWLGLNSFGYHVIMTYVFSAEITPATKITFFRFINWRFVRKPFEISK